MQLRMKSSDSQAYSNALFKLNVSSIKNAARHQQYELLNRCFDHEESQDNSKNDDENVTFETV